jgi:hypothetical protein
LSKASVCRKEFNSLQIWSEEEVVMGVIAPQTRDMIGEVADVLGITPAWVSYLGTPKGEGSYVTKLGSLTDNGWKATMAAAKQTLEAEGIGDSVHFFSKEASENSPGYWGIRLYCRDWESTKYY